YDRDNVEFDRTCNGSDYHCCHGIRTDMDSLRRLIESTPDRPLACVRAKFALRRFPMARAKLQAHAAKIRVAHQEIIRRNAPAKFLPVLDWSRRPPMQLLKRCDAARETDAGAKVDRGFAWRLNKLPRHRAFHVLQAPVI